MRIGILTTLALLMCVMLTAQDTNRVDDQGRKQGAWRKYFEDSKAVFYEGQFNDDEPVGLFIYYYQNGNVKGEMNYRSDGVFNRTYHSNSNLMAEGKYIEQKKDSVWTYYSFAGDLSSREDWDQGAKHGIEEVYFDSGQVSERTTHVDGLRNGTWEQFYENGQLKVSGLFVQDEFDGPIQYYHINGTKEVTGTYNDGVRTGTWMYYNDDGSVRYQAVFRGGKKIKERYENGTFNTYGGDNIILSTVTYKNGLKEGEFQEFYDDAQFKLIPFTDPKTGESYQKEVKMGNELKRKGTYLNDLLEGELYYYNELGREIKRESYKKGELQ